MDEYQECSSETCWCKFTDYEDCEDELSIRLEVIIMAAKKKKAPKKPMKPKC